MPNDLKLDIYHIKDEFIFTGNSQDRIDISTIIDDYKKEFMRTIPEVELEGCIEV